MYRINYQTVNSIVKRYLITGLIFVEKKIEDRRLKLTLEIKENLQTFVDLECSKTLHDFRELEVDNMTKTLYFYINHRQGILTPIFVMDNARIHHYCGLNDDEEIASILICEKFYDITGEYFSSFYRKMLGYLQKAEVGQLEHFTFLTHDICFKKRDHLIKAVFGFESALIKQISQTEQAIAHIRVNKMMALIIREYVKDCEACIYINHITKKYDLFMMDCVDLRRHDDQNDQYSLMFNLINKTSELGRDSLKFLFENFGVPVAIQSDNSQEFKNTLLEAFLTDLNIKIIHGRPHNPKRWHKTGGRRWMEHLNNVFMHIREQYIIRLDVAKHFKNYRERILENNNLNRLKRDFSSADQVLIKKTRLRYKY
ncbi:hypothetical protein CWI38_2134p0010 [Hamiltosporidium tvaerminnensis]|uniref:Integrase catalytic domain-containing protein n=1 Tax=Hamiltosporidium tvaerminnensis TaxID=1176355 RepID=A0A4Q9LPZ3_9MICR|nr:hypothetical protein CWI38_2134p0010 [Hamiltosporidium tvaerminnensis]